MREEDLDILLEKFYAGETSLEEEQILSRLFISGDVPDGYESEKEIFRFMAEEAMMQPASPDLNDRIISSIDEHRKDRPRFSLHGKIFQLSGIAAAILIIIATWFFITRSNEPADTFDDPEIAYATAMKVLYNVSSMLNEETGSLRPISKMNTGSLKTLGVFDETKKMAGKNLRTLDYINRTIEMTVDKENKNKQQ